MENHLSTAHKPSLAAMLQTRWALAALLILVIVVAAAIEPLAALAAAGGVLLLLGYCSRRDWLLGAVFVFLLFQNLVFERLLPVNSQLASGVKHADDFLTVLFVIALAVEAIFPAFRLGQIPQGRPMAAVVGICLLSGLYNHLAAKEIAIGSYVILKNFVWFFLAASIRLDDRGYRRVFHFLFVVLGALLAFSFFQLATGDLTYDLLGLYRDYRFGILRLRAIFIHPVYLAESMALLGVLAVSAYVQFGKPSYLVVAVGALIAVGLTMLAKTILALGLAVGFLLLRKRPWLIVPYAIGAAAAMFNFSQYGSENIQHQVELYIESPQSTRREAFRICGEILHDSPLLGVGPGMFGGYAAKVLGSPIPARYGFINYDGLEYSTLDTHWPHLVAELGLVGLLAYGWLLWAAGRASWRLSSRPELSPYVRTLSSAAAVFLLVMVIEAFAAANLEDALCGFMVFSMLGLTQGYRRTDCQSARS